MTLLQRGVDELLRELVEVWTSLDRFCRHQVGVSPRTLLQSSGFSDVKELEAEEESVEPEDVNDNAGAAGAVVRAYRDGEIQDVLSGAGR